METSSSSEINNSDGYTPLHHLAKSGDSLKMSVEEFVDSYKEDVNKTTVYEKATPIQFALMHRNYRLMVYLLCIPDININSVNNYEQSLTDMIQMYQDSVAEGILAFYKGRQVVSEEALNLLESLLPSCSICMAHYFPSYFKKACTSAKCQEKLCQKCYAEHYRNPLGTLVDNSKLKCPFCHQLNIPIANYSDDHYYARCFQCEEFVYLVDRSCVDEPPLLPDIYICKECQSIKGIRAKKCPKCGILTEKIGGCNHVTCSVCGIHWCWKCRDIFHKDNIYDHMRNEHGGIYGD